MCKVLEDKCRNREKRREKRGITAIIQDNTDNIEL